MNSYTPNSTGFRRMKQDFFEYTLTDYAGLHSFGGFRFARESIKICSFCLLYSRRRRPLCIQVQTQLSTSDKRLCYSTPRTLASRIRVDTFQKNSKTFLRAQSECEIGPRMKCDRLEKSIYRIPLVRGGLLPTETRIKPIVWESDENVTSDQSCCSLKRLC